MKLLMDAVEKKNQPPKVFFFFFVFLRFEVFFCWKWALDSSGWLKKKLGHWDSSVSSRFHGFQNGQSVESFGPLGAGADPKICRQPSLSKLGLDLGGPNSHPLGDIHKIGKSLWPFWDGFKWPELKGESSNRDLQRLGMFKGHFESLAGWWQLNYF